METIAARYRLEEKIGTGGEARVFRATDQSTGLEIAVRLLPKEGAESLGDRARDLPAPHPGWVRLLDRGVDPAHGSYAVFELLHGETLAALTRSGPLPSAAWLAFARQSLDAVGALHEAGWVHGDLNADNFLLETGTTWKLLELPFHHAAPGKKRSTLFGSIYTLSPEQFANQPANVRSDLYALGCLYYKAASGAYPHAGGSEAGIAIGRIRFPAEPLRERAREFPEKFAGWVMRLIERDPADRPGDAGAARQLLELAAKPA
jgi:serine/threonine protein kinase